MTEDQTNQSTKNYRGKGILGLLLLFAGITLLFNNLGVLPWSVWEDIWKFWPVLIILWGLQVILGVSLINHLLAVFLGFALTWIILVALKLI